MMPSTKPTDVRVTAAEVFFIPVTMRVPLKFGPETVTNVVCLRVRVTVTDGSGKTAQGWGETPLSVSWVWPSSLSVAVRAQRMQDFSTLLAQRLVESSLTGHPMEIGHDFMHGTLAATFKEANQAAGGDEMPYLGSLVAFSAFDIAVHDAYGVLHDRDIYSTYNAEFMSRDLSAFITPEDGSGIDFRGRYPQDYLVMNEPEQLPVWHLVGGVDALEAADLNGTEPQDAHPLLLADWIKRDGLKCLKVKLRGTDAAWDFERMQRVGRKPLFLDESAHDWEFVRLGRRLGWSGVALKTCKTQTGALLSLCWAKAHGMPLMVQDLTNPMLAMIPHVRLAAHAGTIQGVECNAMQFYPDASLPEQEIHPGLFQRRGGIVDLSTLSGPGFGYRADEVKRSLS
jgi:L-alanine-DL-glutamate epimerase-like enolase superfamily enzyme